MFSFSLQTEELIKYLLNSKKLLYYNFFYVFTLMDYHQNLTKMKPK